MIMILLLGKMVIYYYIMKKESEKIDLLSPGKRKAQLKSLDEAARLVLSGIFGENRMSDRVLAAYFREKRCCGSRDRALISETIYSTLRYWGFLRKYLPQERRDDLEFGKVRFSQNQLGALLCAAAFIAGNQDSAAVLQENLLLPKLPAAAGTPVRRARQLSDYFGVPHIAISEKDMVPQWVLSALPPEMDAAAFLDALMLRPPMWIRFQCVSGEEKSAALSELSACGAEVVLHERMPDAAMVRAKINLCTLEAYRSGKFEIQDLGSQCVGAVCAPRSGERWLDACAGAGGKSLQLAAMMRRKGSVTAGDVRIYKLEELRKRARRAGFPNIMTKENSAALRRPKHPYDGVLVDAPCSCAGVWRRNPGSQWQLKESEVAELAAEQLQILQDYAAAVRTGGVLVYATCSLFDLENSGVVRKFLAENENFKLDPFEHPLTGEVMPGMMRVDGYKFDCDTLFAARLRRVK